MDNLHSMVRAAMGLAQQGVLYTKKGALCPLCGKKMCITDTKKDVTYCIRWHRCKNDDCLLASMALLVKSVETR